MKKLLLFLCLLLTALGASAEKVAQIIWCEENTTLYFTYDEPVTNGSIGDVRMPTVYYSEADNTLVTVTAIWSGTDVTEAVGIAFPEWSENSDVTRVVFETSFAKVRPLSCEGWFARDQQLHEIDGIQFLNTSEVSSMDLMFSECPSLRSIDVSNFDISNLTSAYGMFSDCINLQTIYCDKNWAELQPTMYSGEMFNNCSELKGAIDYNFFCENDATLANPIDGYFTAGNAQVLYCQGESTLYFVNSSYNYNAGDEFDGIHGRCIITDAWRSPQANDWRGESGDRPWALLYGSSLTTVVFDASFAAIRPNTCKDWFADMTELTDIIGIRNFNTSNVTDMSRMFYRCSKLSSLNLSSFITNKVTDMSEMFSDCFNLTSLNISSFETNNVTSMYAMFKYCPLTTLDLSHFNTSNVTDMSDMFWSCPVLTHLELSSFNTSNVTDMSSMFYECSSLTSLDVSNFDVANVGAAPFMFAGCNNLQTIYCDDDWYDIRPDMDSDYMFAKCNKLKGAIDYIIACDDHAYANPTTGYFTGKSTANRIAQAIFCEGNNTLYFTYDKPHSVGETYNGEEITDMWSDDQVTDWRNYGTVLWGSYESDIHSVVFDPSFASVRPLTCESWFAHMIDLSNITGLQYLNTSNVTSMEEMFINCEKLTSINVSNFNTASVTNMKHMFYNCSSLTSLNVSSFNTSNVTDMEWMFFGCNKLTTLNLSNFNTSKVTGMGGMFYNCSQLTSLNVSNFNTGNVLYMGDLFYGCSSLTTLDVSNFNTAKVTDMNRVFYNCSALTTIYCDKDWNPGSVTSSNNMFSGCDNLVGAVAYDGSNDNDVTFANPFTGYFTDKRTPQVLRCGTTLYFINDETVYAEGDTYNGSSVSSVWSGSQVTNTGTEAPGWYSKYTRYIIIDPSFANVRPKSCHAWFGCDLLSRLQSITGLQYLNTSLVTDMSEMFYDCPLSSLALSNFDTHNVTNMSKMFSFDYGQQSKLESLDLSSFNTSNVTDMSEMFSYCTNLTNLDLSTFDTRNVTDMSQMFRHTSLSSLNLSGLDFSNVTNMDNIFLASNDITSINLSGATLSNVICEKFSTASNLTSINFENVNTSKMTTMAKMFYNCPNLTSIDLTSFNTSNVTDMAQMFYSCPKLTSLNLTSFNTSNVSNIEMMFGFCDELKSVNLSGLNFSNVVNEQPRIFWFTKAVSSIDLSGATLCNRLQIGGSNLTSLNLKNINISNVTDMIGFLAGSSSLTSLDLSDLDFSNVNEMLDMLNGCSSLTYINLSGTTLSNGFCNSQYYGSTFNIFKGAENLTSINFKNTDTSKMTTMSGMFAGCAKLTSLDLSSFNTSNVSRYDDMFNGCSALTNIIFPSSTNAGGSIMNNMFKDCTSLTSLDLSSFNTSGVYQMNNVFDGCTALTSVDLSSFNTSIVQTMKGMFKGCSALISLDLSSFETTFYLSNMDDIFNGCSALKSIYIGDKWNLRYISHSDAMFKDCTSLVGGNGTLFSDVDAIDKTYAVADTPDTPGLLTNGFYLTNSGSNAVRLDANLELTPHGGVILHNRTLYHDGAWNTICLPFSLTAAELADTNCPLYGATIKTLSDATIGEEDGMSTLKLSFEDADAITAGQPYLIKWDALEDAANPKFSNATITATEGSSIDFGDVQFIGSLDPVAFTKDDKNRLYMGADNKLYYSVTGNPLGSCRAYFQLSDNALSRAQQIVLDFGDGTTTGIRTEELNKSNADTSVYDLQGRRVLYPQKGGMYIVNGKKVIY